MTLIFVSYDWWKLSKGLSIFIVTIGISVSELVIELYNWITFKPLVIFAGLVLIDPSEITALLNPRISCISLALVKSNVVDVLVWYAFSSFLIKLIAIDCWLIIANRFSNE